MLILTTSWCHLNPRSARGVDVEEGGIDCAPSATLRTTTTDTTRLILTSSRRLLISYAAMVANEEHKALNTGKLRQAVAATTPFTRTAEGNFWSVCWWSSIGHP